MSAEVVAFEKEKCVSLSQCCFMLHKLYITKNNLVKYVLLKEKTNHGMTDGMYKKCVLQMKQILFKHLIYTYDQCKNQKENVTNVPGKKYINHDDSMLTITRQVLPQSLKYMQASLYHSNNLVKIIPYSERFNIQLKRYINSTIKFCWYLLIRTRPLKLYPRRCQLSEEENKKLLETVLPFFSVGGDGCNKFVPLSEKYCEWPLLLDEENDIVNDKKNRMKLASFE